MMLLSVCTFEKQPSLMGREMTSLADTSYDMGSYNFPWYSRNSVLCGWTQVHNFDTFDWTRQRGKTPSWRTGPSGDKTTGKGTLNLKKIIRNLAKFILAKNYFETMFRIQRCKWKKYNTNLMEYYLLKIKINRNNLLI